jgi:hypothetical protein
MTTVKQRLKERRAINRALAVADSKHRCGTCKRVLRVIVYQRWGDSKMYCSADCLADAEQR